MSKAIQSCRICGNHVLKQILDLGEMELSGVFPEDSKQHITSGSIRLVKCSACGLVQLDHNFPQTEMYGENYGYRSGLNASMVKHLEASVKTITDIVKLETNDVILDIGSNDGTLLGFYPQSGLTIVGMDPTIKKFKDYYKPHILRVEDFFSAKNFRQHLAGKKAKIITSFSMFYDLETPQQFVNEIKEILAPQGMWIFEQSYLPTMVAKLSFDTICHEHLEYYCIEQVKYMLDLANLKILDVQFNDVNGGSFVVYASHADSSYVADVKKIESLIIKEHELGYNGLDVFKKFEESVMNFKKSINELVDKIKSENKTIVALGASTKGNVLLQYCGLNSERISAIGEVNPYKYGKLTPKTHIPIISEDDIKKMNPDYKLVLPWHFKETFLNKEKEYIKSGGKLIFPLPEIDIISNNEANFQEQF